MPEGPLAQVGADILVMTDGNASKLAFQASLQGSIAIADPQCLLTTWLHSQVQPTRSKG